MSWLPRPGCRQLAALGGPARPLFGSCGKTWGGGHPAREAEADPSRVLPVSRVLLPVLGFLWDAPSSLLHTPLRLPQLPPSRRLFLYGMATLNLGRGCKPDLTPLSRWSGSAAGSLSEHAHSRPRAGCLCKREVWCLGEEAAAGLDTLSGENRRAASLIPGGCLLWSLVRAWVGA